VLVNPINISVIAKTQYKDTKRKKHKAIRQKQYIKQEKVWSRLDTFLEVCVLVVIKKKLQQGEEE
jgi:hypothetical protein